MKSELLDSNGNTVVVDNIYREDSSDDVEVFNFKLEDYHTYYVGENCILVHNANYDTELISKNMKSKVLNDELEPPAEKGRAPISKEDGHPIEIHHDGQKPEGPFKNYINRNNLDTLILNQPGGGIRFELPDSVKNLIKNGFLKEIYFGG